MLVLQELQDVGYRSACQCKGEDEEGGLLQDADEDEDEDEDEDADHDDNDDEDGDDDDDDDDDEEKVLLQGVGCSVHSAG